MLDPLRSASGLTPATSCAGAAANADRELAVRNQVVVIDHVRFLRFAKEREMIRHVTIRNEVKPFAFRLSKGWTLADGHSIFFLVAVAWLGFLAPLPAVDFLLRFAMS